jgi:hypothetical protein
LNAPHDFDILLYEATECHHRDGNGTIREDTGKELFLQLHQPVLSHKRHYQILVRFGDYWMIPKHLFGENASSVLDYTTVPLTAMMAVAARHRTPQKYHGICPIKPW